MKNIMSKKLFGVSYDALPLASEIIVDLKLSQIRYKALTCSLSLILIITVVTMCNILR